MLEDIEGGRLFHAAWHDSGNPWISAIAGIGGNALILGVNAA